MLARQDCRPRAQQLTTIRDRRSDRRRFAVSRLREVQRAERRAQWERPRPPPAPSEAPRRPGGSGALCRLCLSARGDTRPIFSQASAGSRLKERILACVHVKASPSPRRSYRSDEQRDLRSFRNRAAPRRAASHRPHRFCRPPSQRRVVRFHDDLRPSRARRRCRTTPNSAEPRHGVSRASYGQNFERASILTSAPRNG